MKLSTLIDESNVVFGTSGARGLVKDMTDLVCYAYTKAFLQYLEQKKRIKKNSEIAVAGDLRHSTDRILKAVFKSIDDMGYVTVNCGKIPTPALTYFGIKKRIPSIMVTGSHVPADRNGIKFNTEFGEILKSDETEIISQEILIPSDDFTEMGHLIPNCDMPIINHEAEKLFTARYLNFFPKQCLKNMRIGLYRHSSVGKDLLENILINLGAEVISLGDSDIFIPVDTEAIRPEDEKKAKIWAKEYHLDSIVSMDGDSDRPLVGDKNGIWARGDVIGILCSEFLYADAVVVPVSCNTAVEKCNKFRKVIRTKIGSPYVIKGMMEAVEMNYKKVVGYEANGGFLLATDFFINGRFLDRLPTRDSFIVILLTLYNMADKKLSLNNFLSTLPRRYTHSNRVKKFPPSKSKNIISSLFSISNEYDKSNVERIFGKICGIVKDINSMDGLRIEFVNGDIIHLRPSGNAPEFRCYTESNSERKAIQINNDSISIIEKWKDVSCL